MSDLIRHTRNYIILIIVSAIMGLLLLLATYVIPNQKGSRIYQNVEKSIDMLEQFGENPVLLTDFQNAHIDYYTDSLMLNEIIYNGDENILEKALLVPNYGIQNGGWPQALKNQIEGYEDSKVYIQNYARYWHGYLVILKPLLLIFSYQELLNINQLLQMLLVTYTAFLIKKHCGKVFVLPYLFSVFCLMPVAVAMSLQFSNMFYMAMISAILYLKYKNNMEKKKILPEFYMVVGIITAYMDFLTYPLLVLGILLTLDVICNQQEYTRKKIQRMIVFTMWWAGGYFGMWFSKWILVSICIQYDIFKEAFEMIRYRMDYSVAEETITYSKVIKYNIYYIFNKISYIIPFIAMVGYYLIRCIVNVKNRKTNLNDMCAYIYIMVLPFIWYAFTANHSCQHNYFTNRTVVVTIFAGFCMLAQIGRKIEKNNIQDVENSKENMEKSG